MWNASWGSPDGAWSFQCHLLSRLWVQCMNELESNALSCFWEVLDFLQRTIVKWFSEELDFSGCWALPLVQQSNQVCSCVSKGAENTFQIFYTSRLTLFLWLLLCLYTQIRTYKDVLTIFSVLFSPCLFGRTLIEWSTKYYVDMQ